MLLLEVLLIGIYYTGIAYITLMLLRNDIFIVPLYCLLFGLTTAGIAGLFIPKMPWWLFALGTVLFTALFYVGGLKAHRVENVFQFVPAAEEEVEEEEEK